MQGKLQKKPYTQHLFAISVSDLRTLFYRKNYLCTFLSQKEFAHTFFVANMVYAFFFAKTIYALGPESFCALKVAIRKVQTFWASAVIVYSLKSFSKDEGVKGRLRGSPGVKG